MFKNYFIKCFTILVSNLSVLSISVLTVNAQNKSENQKTQVITSQISFENPIPLVDSLEKATQLLNENSEVTVSLNGWIELEKLSLPMSLQVQNGDNLEKLTQKWQEIKKSQLQSLIKSKEKETELLQTPIWNDTKTENLLEELTILRNIESNELQTQLQTDKNKSENKKGETAKNEEILIESLTISRTNLNPQTDEIINKIAQNSEFKVENIDLINAAKDDTRDEILKPKTKLNSNAKIAKKSAKVENKNNQNQQSSSLSNSISPNLQTSISATNSIQKTTQN